MTKKASPAKMGPKPISRDALDSFLVELKNTCNITRSARNVGHSRRTMYNYKEKDERFAKAWDDALEEGIDNLEYLAQERAFGGIERGIYYQGKKIATEREYSDGLVKFLLRAHKPKRYGNDQGLPLVAVGGVLVVPESAKLSIEEWKAQHELTTGNTSEIIDVDEVKKE